MGLLLSGLTNEQKVIFLKQFSEDQESAGFAVKKYFPRTTQRVRTELLRFYKRGMQKGSAIYKEAIEKEYDDVTVVNLAELVIANDVRDVIHKLPKLYQDKKRNDLTVFYRKSISEGAINTFDYHEMLDSFVKENSVSNVSESCIEGLCSDVERMEQ
jgi:hypothetical protein